MHRHDLSRPDKLLERRAVEIQRQEQVTKLNLRDSESFSATLLGLSKMLKMWKCVILSSIKEP